jgi:hypothetical protein
MLPNLVPVLTQLTDNPRNPCHSFQLLAQTLWNLAPMKCLNPNNPCLQFGHISRVTRLNNLTFALITPECKPENTPQKIIQSVRKFMQKQFLDPGEVLLASSLHHTHASLLRGHTPKDPNIKALSIIMQTIGYPGRWSLLDPAGRELLEAPAVPTNQPTNQPTAAPVAQPPT